MRVYVKTDGKRFFIPVPLGIVKLGLMFVKTPFIVKHIPEKSRKYMDMIDFNELSKCINVLKKYKGLRLVEVKDKDGTEVTITI